VKDDLLNEAYSRDVCDRFTKGSNHRNISVILMTHNVSSGTLQQGHIAKAKYLVFKNVRDKNQFAYLAR
jgi:hypothetical protein